jgi:hypothetical protein
MGPTEARNDADFPRVVRLVGSAGSVDLAVPAHSMVRLTAPASIGTVRSAWWTNQNCYFGAGQTYGDGTNGRAAFEAGGLMVYGSSIMSFSDTSGWVATTPPPAPDAATTTVCASVSLPPQF